MNKKEAQNLLARMGQGPSVEITDPAVIKVLREFISPFHVGFISNNQRIETVTYNTAAGKVEFHQGVYEGSDIDFVTIRANSYD